MIRLIRAILNFVTFGLVKTAEQIERHPGVVKVQYERQIKEKKATINLLVQAHGVKVALQEKALERLKVLAAETKKLRALKEGALAKAKSVAERLQGEGKSEADVKQSPEYMRAFGFYRDFSTTLAEKEERLAEKEAEIHAREQEIAQNDTRLGIAKRELDALKEEAGDAVAEILTATEEKNANDILSGIADNGSAERLERLRDIRLQVRAEAKVSSKLAGTDKAHVEAEFLQYAQTADADSDFDALVFGKKEAAAPARTADERLPE